MNPISPQEALAATPTINDDIIARINASLSKPWTAYDRSAGRWIDVRAVGCHETWQRDQVVDHYTAAGWQVRVHSDQRDGTAFVFGAP